MSDEKVVPLRVVETASAPPSVSMTADMLESVRSRVLEQGISKAVVLLLDDQGPHYDTTIMQSGMTIPEVLALLSVCMQDTHLAMRGEV
jgi:hypothetical protein